MESRIWELKEALPSASKQPLLLLGCDLCPLFASLLSIITNYEFTTAVVAQWYKTNVFQVEITISNPIKRTCLH